ncbi:MAG: N-acetylmuramoyl-L-alanine amidase [Candidatus Methylacidiphilales bacterium]
MRRLVLSVILIASCLTTDQGLAQGSDLDTIRFSSREWHRINAFSEAYGFSKPHFKGEPGSSVEIKGPYGKIEFFEGDRKAKINGLVAWLSFPIIQGSDGQWLISKADVENLMAPILRPDEVIPRKRVRGVVVDPGHGGADRGARTASGYTEKAATLATSIHLKSLLEKDSIPVVMTRSSDVFVSLQERANLANRYPEYLYISIHYNSVTQRHVNGVEIYSMSPRGTPSTSSGGKLQRSDFDRYEGNRHDLQNAWLMDLMHRELMTMHTEKGDRGRKRARFVVLREVAIPAVLVEGGFMSNPVDGRLIESDSYRKKVANAVFRAIKNYIEMMNSRPRPPFYKLRPTEAEPEVAQVVVPVAPVVVAPPSSPVPIIVAPPPVAPEPTSAEKAVPTSELDPLVERLKQAVQEPAQTPQSVPALSAEEGR